MADCNAKPTSLPVGIILGEKDCPTTEDDRKYMVDKPYHKVLGKLNWGAGGIWLDIIYGIGVLSHFQSNPRPNHWKAMLHMMAYIKGMLDFSITYYCSTSIKPITYIDASYADDFDTRQSTAGYSV